MPRVKSVTCVDRIFFLYLFWKHSIVGANIKDLPSVSNLTILCQEGFKYGFWFISIGSITTAIRDKQLLRFIVTKTHLNWINNELYFALCWTKKYADLYPRLIRQRINRIYFQYNVNFKEMNHSGALLVITFYTKLHN